MTAGTGLSAQLMIAEETTYGTYVAPTRTLDLINESLKLKIERIESLGLRAGRIVEQSVQWSPGRRSAAGDINTELTTTNQGLLFKHMFGAIAAAGSSPVYTYTATPADLFGKSLSIQVGKPDLTGVVRPFSYTGCKFTSWELACKAGETAKLKLSVVAQDESTVQTLGTPTYPAAPSLQPLTFVGASLSLGGTQVDVADVTLKGDNKLDAARFRLRGASTPKEQLITTFRDYTGVATADFTDLTTYNRFLNATEAAMVFTFNGPAIPTSATLFSVVITCNVRLEGDTPDVAGPGALVLPVNYKAIASGAADSSAISLAYTTSDAAA